MKKYALLFLTLVFLVSCEKNTIGDFGDPAFTDPTEDAVNKKGVCFTNSNQRWSHKTSELGAYWMYSWGNVLREEIPENVEFVPMFWGANSVSNENITRIQQLIDEGKVKYVLGFNEPDGTDQANMSVEEAIALWPTLEQLNVPLVSPAAVNPTNEWMTEFMQKVDELGLRVDYVAVHHYGGSNVLSFINKLKQTYEAYNRPIWVTEFAVADWNATSPENNSHSEEEVAAFMQETLTALDDIDWVFRYSWFDGRNAALYTSALYDDENVNQTYVGSIYANHNPNPDIGPGVDTEYVPPIDEDELLINGGFETAQLAPWQGFNNAVVGIATTEPYTGNYCGRLNNNDGSLFYVLNVDPGETYTLKFFSKWRDPVPNTFSAKIRNNNGNALLFSLPDMPQTDVWEETEYEFTVPNDVSEIKILFYKGQVNPTFPPFFLDDVSLKVTP
ncbi:MAG: glycosyl hydrolase [Flavobacteriaceae bacterium]|nr:carbohydrate binding domain-containing protein [Mangrovimonas sp.]MCB0425780.1 carbohydrate binding domain-containing protein [Mangrovimonas sp.]MCB0437141.1 carbohydrate binding domain-containing protein [Mangrovimonas sp.]HPF96780.1 glycosyl hydrolase [Mangrovimonas sp.]